MREYFPILVAKRDGTTVQTNSSYSGINYPYHNVVVDWVVAGGSASDSTKSAMSAFFTGLDADGITYGSSGKIKRLNLFCGASLTDCLRPQILSLGNSTDTNNGPFVSGDYVETGSSGGLTGDGSTKYLSTGVSNSDSAIPQQDYSVGTYLKFSSFSGNTYALGSDASNRSLALYASGTLAYYFTLGSGASQSTPTQGWFSGGTSTDFGRLFKNGTQVSTTAANPTVLSGTIEVFRATSNVLSSTVKVASYYIGQYLGATDQANLYSRMQTFQTSLGRQV
jgi:hypothetical protein